VRRPRIEALEDRCLLAVITEFSNGITGSGLNGITNGPNGNLWFTESNSSLIGQITPSGVVTEFAPALSGSPLGITTGPDQNLWFSEGGGVRVGRLTTGGSLTEFDALLANTGGAESPATATVGPDGNLWFVTVDNAPNATSAVIRVTPSGTVTVFTAGITPHSELAGITAGPDGNLWFTEFNASQIGRITPTGIVTEFPAAGTPVGIVTGPDGNLWATEFNGSAIIRIDPSNGQVTGTFTNGITGTNPIGITVGPDNDLWFTEFGGDKIGRLDPTTGQVTTFPVPTAGSQPFGIALGPDNNLWFTENTGDKIGRLDTAAVIVPGAASVSAVEGGAFSGDVATFTNANPQTPASDYGATIDWGDGTPTTAGVITVDAGGTYHVTGGHTYAEDGSENITVTIQHISTNTSVQQASTASVADAPLTAQVAPVSATEDIPLSGVPVVTFQDANPSSPSSDFPLANITIDWGDGSPTSTATALSTSGVPGNNFSYVASGSHTYTNPGSYAVHVTVKDQGGAVIDAFGTAVVQDGALTVTGVDSSATEGTPFSGTVATFTDAGPQTPSVPADYSAAITWGDGVTNPGTVATNPNGPGFIVNGTHTFEEGSFIAGVAVTDNASGKTFQAPLTFSVADAPLTGAAGIPVAAVEGRPLNNVPVATFTDGNPLATASDYTAAIDWGDGVTSPGSFTVVSRSATATILQVSGSHLYAMAGAFPIGVTVTDVGGQTLTSTAALATVADAPLSSSGASIVGTEGTSLTAPVATFTDADPNGVVGDYTAVITWGDGTTGAGTISAIGASPNGEVFIVSGTHAYTEEGTYPVTATISDVGGSKTFAATQSVIADAALTAAPSFVATNAGQSFTLAVASFTDADPNGMVSDYTATIDWGDGTPASAGTIVANNSGGFSVFGTHTYAASLVPIGGGGSFTITTTIHDAGGASVTVSGPASVLGVPIVVPIVVPINLTGQLNPSSDSGVSNQDAITNVTQPNFFGNSAPGSIIQLFAQATSGGNTFLIGQGVTDASGFWSVNSNVLAQGQYIITAMATDSSGHTVANATILPSSHPLVIDTAGPKVTRVFFDRVHGQIDVTFQDNLSGMDQAQVVSAANYLLTKQNARRGMFLVNKIMASPGGPTSPEPVVLTFNNARQIRGGTYIFTIFSRGIRDVAGNALDGEFFGFFPSGNNLPGGNFVAGLGAVHHTIFAPKTLLGHATPVVPPGTPSSGVTTIPTANPNLHSGNPNLIRARTRNLHVKLSKAHVSRTLAIHDKALSQLSGPRLTQ
jgi:streptogramin lyase